MGRPKGSKNKKTIEKELKLVAKKTVKKMPAWLIIILLMIIIGIIAYLYYKQNQEPDVPNHNIKDGIIYLAEENTSSDELKVTFLELLDNDGDGQIGDSVFIEYGDVDILIDAGDKNEGTNTVVPFIETNVQDHILELVIVTHADADHLGGMVGLSSGVGALEISGITYQYLVDFGYIGDTKLYEDYTALRQTLINKGTKYFSIGSIFDPENQETATKFYLGVDAVLDFLDYGTYDDEDIDDDNDRSVSCLITHKDKKFLLCGDAEKKEEEVLTSLNIGHVDVFKANHHGSPTSNSTQLLNNITPDYVVICSSEENSYELPKKVIINRIINYTENVYATFISGNIVFVSKNNQISVSSTRTLTNVQDSTWYLTDDPENPR